LAGGKGLDLSFEKIRELPVSGAIYRVYRTNGGATTNWGIALRKERPLIAGMKLVTRLGHFDARFEAEVEELAGGVIRLTLAPLMPNQETAVVDFEP
jgi:hypothetical protein